MALGSSATIRILLTGVQGTLAGMTAVEAKVTGLTEKLAVFGAVEEKNTKRTWLMNQALFTMRRYAYMGTLAFTATAVAFLKWGTSFNETMLSARLQLQKMMPSTRAVNNELQDLFNMAKINPFTFADMTLAFRKMYIGMQPLGVSVATVNRTLKNMVDYLSAAGNVSPGALNRLSVALQHMAYSGRLTGFAVNQLMRDGIPIAAILNKQFGITGDQLHNIAKFGIPAADVLDAINKYAEQSASINGAAARQARTLGGELATLHDNISQTVGALTQRAFTGATGTGGLLQSINNMFNGVSKIILRQQGRISLAQVFGAMGKKYPGLEGLFSFILTISKLLPPFIHLLGDAAKAILLILFILRPVFWVLRLVIGAFDWLIKNIPGLNWIMGYLALVFMYNYIALSKLRIIMFFSRVGANLLSTAWKALVLTGRLLWGVLRILIWAFRGLAVAIMADPVVAIVVGVILLIASLVILYYKWKWFHNLVNSTWYWIRDHWKLLAVILIGPFAVAIYFAIKFFFKPIEEWVMRIIGWVKRLADWISKIHWPRPPGWLRAIWHGVTSVFGGGGGSTIPMANAALAGPGGPLLTPQQNIDPFAAGMAARNKSPFHVVVHNHVSIDGKQVATSVSKQRQKAQARK
jgi:tape measure domain-containing protein